MRLATGIPAPGPFNLAWRHPMKLARDGSRTIALALAVAFLASACAAPAPVPATDQPALAQMAQPYGDGLRRAGISTVMVYGNGARVRLGTRFGDVYFRYPAGLAPTAFALYVGAQDIEVDSDTFNTGNAAQYEAAFKSVLPEAIKRATANNTQEAQQRLGGGGGGGGGGR